MMANHQVLGLRLPISFLRSVSRNGNWRFRQVIYNFSQSFGIVRFQIRVVVSIASRCAILISTLISALDGLR
jgi:hypothetical protein